MQGVGESGSVLHVVSEVDADAGAGVARADRADVACVSGAAEGVEELVDGGIELHGSGFPVGGFSNAAGEEEAVEGVEDDRSPARDPELVFDEAEDVVTGDPAGAHSSGVAGFKLTNGWGRVFEGVDDVTGFGAHDLYGFCGWY